MAACPHCSAELQTPLVCTACGRPLEARGTGPFDALGLAPSWRVDPGELRRRLLRFTRVLHPDYFATGAETLRALAERNTADLNEAFKILSDDYRRASWLVRWLGGPAEKDERSMPQAFLMEVLEWNEALASARDSTPDSPARAALAPLVAELGRQREASFREVARLLDPLPERDSPVLCSARRVLNAVRYVDRALGEAEAIQLGQPSHRD